MMNDERADALAVFVRSTSLRVSKDYLDVLRVRSGYTEVVVRNWGLAHMGYRHGLLHPPLALGCGADQTAINCYPLRPSGL
jgi:hypothetical protein